MNKRIKELAEQCWDRRLDGLHFDQEKFAALVAAHEREECAKIAFNARTYIQAAKDIRARGE
jgi:hypothetical protein